MIEKDNGVISDEDREKDKKDCFDWNKDLFYALY
jgi:hypothetical protein